ncbi:MAG: CoA-binding protein [Chloroflexota bacterium]
MQLNRKIAWDILDAQEGSGPVPLLDGDEPARLLGRTKRIAIVGASPDPGRPSHGVMRQLLDAGYDVVPINPTVDQVLGKAAYATLEDAFAATGPFDMVDVFRRPEHTPDVARSAVAIGAKSLWLQLGVVNWEAAQIARDAGLEVVMDRCTAIEERRRRFLG